MDLHGNIPTFISITDGKVHDVKFVISPAAVGGQAGIAGRRFSVGFRRPRSRRIVGSTGPMPGPTKIYGIFGCFTRRLEADESEESL